MPTITMTTLMQALSALQAASELRFDPTQLGRVSVDAYAALERMRYELRLFGPVAVVDKQPEEVSA